MAAKTILSLNGNDISQLISKYSGHLQVQKSPKLINSLLDILKLENNWLEWITEKELSTNAVNLIQAVDEQDRPQLFGLVQKMRPNQNVFRELVPLLLEISGREHIEVIEIIDSLNAEYENETDHNLLRENVMKQLRSRRTPEKNQIIKEIEDLKTSLDFPKGVLLQKPVKLDPLTLRFQVDADSTISIKESAKKLEECADNEKLKNLFGKFGK
jgi:hypothetical protein